MVRDTDTSKIDFSLVYDGPMLKRWADHLTKGAKKYAPRNWMLAAGASEQARFKASAARHFFQWIVGDRDEDHAAAVVFNINGYEYVSDKLATTSQNPLQRAIREAAEQAQENYKHYVQKMNLSDLLEEGAAEEASRVREPGDL